MTQWDSDALDGAIRRVQAVGYPQLARAVSCHVSREFDDWDKLTAELEHLADLLERSPVDWRLAVRQ